jgi:polyhydroxyalkanoate synthesis regulator phasin
MLRRLVLALVVAAGLCLTGAAYGQMGPGGPGGFGGGGPGGGPGGFDPAMIQQMQQMGQQVMQNMQNAGVDPQQFFQEQMQNGNFDPQSMAQTLVDKGFMTQDMYNQMNNMMTQMQQQFPQGNPGMMPQNNALNNIRQQLGVTADDEWNVLLPKIQRVLTALADVEQNTQPTMGNRMGGGFGGRGGAANVPVGTPGAQAAAETPIAKAWRELREAVQDVQTPDSVVAAKLSAWRQFHRQAQLELDASQKDLLQLLTLRQEAILMRIGIL